MLQNENIVGQQNVDCFQYDTSIRKLFHCSIVSWTASIILILSSSNGHGFDEHTNTAQNDSTKSKQYQTIRIGKKINLRVINSFRNSSLM